MDQVIRHLSLDTGILRAVSFFTHRKPPPFLRVQLQRNMSSSSWDLA
jgi:hypothetical protein